MFDDLISALIDVDAEKAAAKVAALLRAGVDPFEIIENGIMPGMETVGRKFEEGSYFLPQLLLAAKAVEACTALITPLLNADQSRSKGTIVVGTVAGDIHDLGKNLVISTMESGGFRVIDAGVDVPSEQFVEIARREKAEMIALSALLTTTMTRMEEVIKALHGDPELRYVKVMVGGAPVDQKYADQIGADAYGENALEALYKARELAQKAKKF
jgi:corrinoid protein of di/trimethylamine methyltransferase